MFYDRIAAGTNGGTKQDRIRDFVLLHAPPAFSISDIRRAVPGVSDQTIRLVLTELKAAGKVTVDGSGRGATWQWRVATLSRVRGSNSPPDDYKFG